MCDFGGESSFTPRVIAPSTGYMSGIITDLDTEVSGIDPTVLSRLTQSMAIDFLKMLLTNTCPAV